MDDQPLSDWNFYRLRQVDYDGAFAYHGPVSVRFDAEEREGGVKIYPTAANDQFTLEAEAVRIDNLNCPILNANGQVARFVKL